MQMRSVGTVATITPLPANATTYLRGGIGFASLSEFAGDTGIKRQGRQAT
jgi:hypothetical protein